MKGFALSGERRPRRSGTGAAPPRPPWRAPRASRRGTALVIVLGITVLMLALAVGLLLRAGTERRSVASYHAAATTRQLADTAVNLVQAQISDATTAGSDFAWASQPGAIRLFNSAGGLERIYRLYSSTDLTTASAGDLDADIPPPSWRDAPALWTDLNAPITMATAAGGTEFVFPILDPRHPADPAQPLAVDGFALQNPPGAVTDPSRPDYQPAPMPVRWLYVLQNGEVVGPSGSGSVVSVPGAGRSNPIVGRIAFWTDDETCKININTAADGTFWDTPRFSTASFPDEAKFANNQPMTDEFQAYPGHPATVSLRPVLNQLGLSLPPSPLAQGTSSAFFDLLPVYNDDRGSKGGLADTRNLALKPALKSDRFYASVGELLFSPDREPNGMTEAQASAARFFLTAKSRAPELNLFGKPRVSIWPVYDTPDPNSDVHLTPTDRLIAFCSTIGGARYYFARKDCTDRTADIDLPRNAQLLDYLDDLAARSVPGFGGSFAGKYTQAEMRQILTQIYDYIRCTNLSDSRLSVVNRYAPDWLPPGSHHKGGGYAQVVPIYKGDWQTQGFGRFPVISEIALLFIGTGKGDSEAGTPDGIPVDSRQLPAYAGGAPGAGHPNGGAFPGNLPPEGTTAVQAFLLISFVNPASGNPGLQRPSYTVQVDGLDQFALAGTPLGMPATARLSRNLEGHLYGLDQRDGSPVIDFRSFLANQFARRRIGVTSPNSNTYYPFYSQIVEVPGYNESGTMTFAGGPLTVSLYADVPLAATGAPTKLVQKFEVPFPASIALPISKAIPHNDEPSALSNTPWLFLSGQDVFAERNKSNYHTDGRFRRVFVNADYDVILSMVPEGPWADYRLLAARACHPGGSTPAIPGAFAPHPNAGQQIAWGMRPSVGQPLPHSTSGNFSHGLAVGDLVPASVNGAYAGGGSSGAPADWDKGMLDWPGFPGINKADEGTASYGHQQASQESFRRETLFTPNRLIPSAVVFGSLPTGVKRELPWQTLLFRPGPDGHPGEASPKDHLLLDWFWMPVAEPYAISEPLSTAGKVNLNYQMVPFHTYLTRSTALRAALSAEKVAMVSGAASSGPSRQRLNLSETDGTLRPFKERFDNRQIFRSASEICDVFLVPEGKSWTSDAQARADAHGADFARVGDNMRERPYAHAYAKLTTKSNTYTVYYAVQALKAPLTMPEGTWDENKGAVTGALRGATMLERYIDPNVPIPDYAAAPATATTLENHYRWRVVENQSFSR